jgi:hypothetical protein
VLAGVSVAMFVVALWLAAVFTRRERSSVPT